VSMLSFIKLRKSNKLLDKQENFALMRICTQGKS